MRGIIRQTGLSIIELMVAITLGLILTAGLVQIFSGNQRSFTVAEANMRVQETGRMTVEFLNRAVRNADYWGCIPRDNVGNKLDPTGTGYSTDLHEFEDGFQAYQSDGTVGIAGTDVMVLRGVGGAGDVSIEDEMPNSSANLDVNTTEGIHEGDILLISDCIAGDIFQVTAEPTTSNKIQHNGGNKQEPGNAKTRDGVLVVVDNNCPGDAANCLSKQYDGDAQIFKPYFYQYYLDIVDGRRALYRKDGLKAPVEIMDGVWDFQMRVGIDPGLTTGEASQWVDINSTTALSSAAASEVVAVQISMLVRSPQDRVADAAMAVCYPSWSDCSGGPNFNVATQIDADSRHLYRVYTATSTIRNRVLKVEQNES
ncbi:PilW family protein [Marinobacter profundi]|uniref:Pilus assembly protein PilW n=1 Tax=Marinobacter profundi TaxID=2666256 RepID=A0A2G1UHG1_9GAMM|nr:PilW family protein [Marinobacter profundi]PHQ13928.1 hypothetical protein CLH61_15375 [Marinobacter profundi]